MKTEGDAGPYREAIEELILGKEEDKKLRKIRWEEEKKLKEDKWKETKDDSPAKDIIEKGKLDVGTIIENHVLL